MFRRRDKTQISFLETNKRFVVHIDPENRWVKLSELLPWDKIDDHYALSMCGDSGREGFTSRIAFGAIYAKEQLGVTDEGIMESVSENPYMQYFLGLENFQNGRLFDSSMMVHFRRRFAPGFIAKVNEYIATGNWPDDDNSIQTPEELPPPETVEHKGKLSLDATAAPSDIRYPSDVSILNDCRENLERFMDGLWEECAERTGHKTPYNRQNAHKKYINFIKKKNKNNKIIKSALNAQCNYVNLAIHQVLTLILICGIDEFSDSAWDRFDLICRVYLQQKWMRMGSLS
jgi:hypothetical protein